MTPFRERLWPSPPVYLATALLIPASLLVMYPISLFAGYILAAVLFLGAVAAMLITAPAVSVEEGVFRAGKARIPVTELGEPEAFTGEEAWQERGPRLDARAYLLLNGWAKQNVRVPVTDPADPTPYWLVSTRRAEELAEAIRGAQREARAGDPR